MAFICNGKGCEVTVDSPHTWCHTCENAPATLEIKLTPAQRELCGIYLHDFSERAVVQDDRLIVLDLPETEATIDGVVTANLFGDLDLPELNSARALLRKLHALAARHGIAV